MRKVWTSRQSSSCIQRVGRLLGSMARLYDLWDGALEKHKVRGLDPCCGQDGYRAQVSQHPINSYRYISNIQIYHAQLGQADKKREIIGLVVLNGCDLELLDVLNGLALGCYQPSHEVLIVRDFM